MAYEEIVGLDCDKTVSLGGMNKKTGKKNPTKLEGYYLGFKEIDNTKSKTGKSYLYIFQTPEGNTGVYGKTHLDRLMSQGRTQGKIVPGRMTLVQVIGMTPTKNGDMYTFSVKTDKDNTIDVGFIEENQKENEQSDDSAESLFGATEESAYEEVEEAQDEEEGDDEALPPPAKPPVRRPLASVSPSRQAEVAALLANRKKTS